MLKLAETNKAAACTAFVASYGTCPITYNDNFYYAKNNDGFRFNPHNKNLDIENLPIWKTFLSVFGHLLKEIRVQLDERSTVSWTELVNLIFTHCTALQKLHLYNCSEDDEIELMFRGSSRAQELSRNPLRVTKACPTLESLDAENIYFKAPLNLTELFPNLRSLDLLSIVASDPTFIETNMPRLEHLGFTLYSDNPDSHVIGSHLEVKNIKNAFIYNPQLQSIQLEMSDIDMALVEFINTTLPNLKKIDFTLFEDAAKNQTSANGIVFKNVTSASLGRLGGSKPPIILKQLKDLSFNTVAYKATVDFISKHRQLTSLTMTCQYTDEHALEVVKALPNLQELNMIIENHEKWSAAGLVRFLAICERLDKLMIMIEVDSKDHKNWRSYVSDTWKIENDITPDFYVIEKGNN